MGLRQMLAVQTTSRVSDIVKLERRMDTKTVLLQRAEYGCPTA